jgi:hypothetical protein
MVGETRALSTPHEPEVVALDELDGNAAAARCYGLLSPNGIA